MARKEFLNYVWKYCIEPQLGYSFSLNHTLPYSIIAVQEMNLATRWNPLYWQCACLCVNAGNYETSSFSNEEEEETFVEENDIETEVEEEKKEKRVAPNYGKIAKAIADAQLSGIKIELPDINTAQADFVPDITNNSILYSLQAINVVGYDLLDRIIMNRPYTSLQDFEDKVQPTQSQMIGLIKAGCFDKLCGIQRTTIMAKYLQHLADLEHPIKDKITSVQLKKALELGLNLNEYSEQIRMFKFKKYIDLHQFDKAGRRYILTEAECIRFFNMFIKDKMSLVKGEYGDIPGGICVKYSAFDRIYKEAIDKLMEYLNSEEGKQAYQNICQEDYIKQLHEKYCQGTVSTWEMDTTSCYFSEHELKYMNNIPYNTKDFNTLPEYPTDTKKICTITGTVTDSNNTRHTVTLLTNYGIVDVKFYAGVYTQFNQKISVVDKDSKKKTVIDDSWFKRGTKLIVHGIRRENQFCCKNDYSSGYNRSVGIIDRTREDGTLDIRYVRRKK